MAIPVLSNLEQLVAGFLLILALAIVAVRSKTIDISGALLGAVICFIVFLAGGFDWLVVIIAFFVISSLFTRYRYNYKKNLGSAQEKGGVRSWPNTLSNGLVAGLAAIAELISHQDIFIIAFLAAVAAAMSDTIATEVGLLSYSKPRLLVNLKKFVQPGTSGGVSLLGELAGVASALGISLLGILLKIINGTFGIILSGFLAVLLGAVISLNLDSLLGGTVQGVNRCQVCSEKTESLTHHGQPTVSEKGVRFLDNNAINLITTIAAALLSIILYLGFVSLIS
ncbi:MAG: DUF92 domain-containing protein [Thaumarchaeota archaeon]|nr:DUF92 domain-containing protein [Nitrososphaerota archaeon]